MSDTIETTENLETKPTLESMFLASEEQYALVEAAQLDYEASLRRLAAVHGNTVTDPRNGQIWQIRSRQDSKQGRPITYMCALKAEPATWLKGRAKKQPTAAVAPEVEPVSETGGATVIE